jgi:hypothetical protein
MSIGQSSRAFVVQIGQSAFFEQSGGLVIHR